MQKKMKHIMATCIVLVVVICFCYFIISAPILPKTYNGVIFSKIAMDGNDIQLNDAQTEQLLQVFSKYKTRMSFGVQETTFPTWHFGLLFSDKGNNTIASRGIRVGFNHEMDCYVNGYSSFKSLYRHVVDGEKLYNEVQKLMNSWGY